MWRDCENNKVLTVLDENGVSVYGALQAAGMFRAYYANFYTLQVPYNVRATADYIEHIAIQWLLDAHRERLMAPLRPAEIATVMKGMPNDPVGATRYLLRNLVDMQQAPLLDSPRLPLEWCGWFPMGQERAMLESLNGLGIRHMGDFFKDKVLRDWT
ncbi:hypothetical protein NDU88_000809 [Pleurodeles waltl]|uniref:Uncharacterized protein n=1 Tax=Pleurodeles waltl TaxID=8319 RepID=A0AAV7S810_PLEWA|nr:hypothetical protein NDU88_000809 [Pleurodeles waltl]